MEIILIATLVLSLLVSGSAGAVKWDGKFLKGACNETVCCCPSNDLVIATDGTGSLSFQGNNCAGTSPANFTITDRTQDTHKINGGEMKVVNNILTVTLSQTPSGSVVCATPMQRERDPIVNPLTNSTANGDVPSIHAPLLINLISSMMLLQSVIHA